MNNRILISILPFILLSASWATETINDSLSVQGDIQVGNGATKIIGDYNGSPWFINSTGRFSFGAHHDWDRSFDIYLPNAEGGQTVEIGQRSKNNSAYNYEKIRFRNAYIVVDDDRNLMVEGSFYVGTDNAPPETQVNTYGSKLYLLGAHGNSDELWFARYNVSGSPNASEVRLNIGDDPLHYGDKFVVGVTASDWYPRFVVRGDGNVGIGTDSPSSTLDVAGTIRAEEVIVEAGTADYVFEDGYELRSLSEVEEHIEKHGHLPGVPSAKEVEIAGVSVGESQRLLLEKVEELTLYLIEKDRQLTDLKNEIVLLKSRIKGMGDE